jgi:hypothetical protein
MISPTFVHAVQRQYQAIRPFLDRYKAPPEGDLIAARDLKPGQARDLIIHYHHTQQLTLETWPEFDVTGRVLYPATDENVRIKFEIGGVNYVADNPHARKWTLTKPIDQRLAVLLVRLGQWLRREWGGTIVYWGGLGVGRDSEDRHGRGLAMDVHGVQTQFGEFKVWRDWGAKPVPRTHGGDRQGRWPDSEDDIWFRLVDKPVDPFDMRTSPACPSKLVSSTSSTGSSPLRRYTAAGNLGRESANGVRSYIPTLPNQGCGAVIRITSMWKLGSHDVVGISGLSFGVRPGTSPAIRRRAWRCWQARSRSDGPGSLGRVFLGRR